MKKLLILLVLLIVGIGCNRPYAKMVCVDNCKHEIYCPPVFAQMGISPFTIHHPPQKKIYVDPKEEK